MKLLWLSWKDISNPHAGGAELVMHELSKRLVADGHDVTILTVQYPGASKTEVIDGIKIIRVGQNRYTHPLVAASYYIRHMRNRYNVVIDVVNTAPYMSPFYKGKAKSILMYHQLARKIWFYEAPFPVSLIGYTLLEPVATVLLGKSKTTTITVSESTKKDLARFGFKNDQISIITEGITIEPVEDLGQIKKYKKPTLLIFGAGRSMKRALDQIKAFEIAKEEIPELQLKIAGDMSGPYGKKLKNYLENNRYLKDIEYLGKVSDEKKKEVMRKSHILLATSVKEGWCLVVTEAASQGTPAVVYDVDGLRDSVQHKKTGVICKPYPNHLAEGIVGFLQDSVAYKEAQKAAWAWSKQISFDQSYKDFKQVVGV